jgi:hypothetical protein
MMRDGGFVALASSAIPVAPGEEVSEWLQAHGIGGVKLASALAACEDELLETVGDLRRMAMIWECCGGGVRTTTQ